MLLKIIVISLFFLIKICVTVILTKDEKHLNVSDNKVKKLYNESSIDDFMFEWSNGTRNLKNEQDEIVLVDCLGLGRTIARTLEWFFRYGVIGSGALDVKFYMTSRKSRHRSLVLLGSQFGLEWVDFVPERKTVIIVHGFLSHGDEEWIADMENAFLQWDDANMIILDWSAGGNTWNYYKAVINTQIVGSQIALFLESIVNATERERGKNGIAWGQLHLVGHSLGAHICGFAAKELKKKSLPWIANRITGLDPAQPCFKNADKSMHLHKTDAPFVDVIHTNGKLLSEIGLGLPEVLGHVDFYPNGGKTQPGCVLKVSSLFNYLPIPQAAIRQAICSHGRSYRYLTESLISAVAKNCSFWAPHWNFTWKNLERITREPCTIEACTEMGINAINYSRDGTFFVSTLSHAPFCSNKTELEPEVRNQLVAEYLDEILEDIASHQSNLIE